MEEVTLVAESGRATGSRPAGRLRRQGKVPGVLYGHGIAPVPLAVDQRALRSALTTEAGFNALITLQVDGDRHLAMARQLQRDPVRGSVQHVDFVIVRRDEVISASVPIHLVGDAEQVTKNDGLVAQELFTLAVNALPGDIPPGIEVDVSGLAIGDAIRVGDVKLPDGVTTDLDPETTVVMGQASTVAAEVEAVEAAAEEAAAEAAGEAAPEAAEAEAAAAEAGDTEAASGEGGSGGEG